jgi:hypothetical protein
MARGKEWLKSEVSGFYLFSLKIIVAGKSV